MTTTTTITVREFSIAGPCLTRGRLVRQTAQFYVWNEWRGGDRFGDRETRGMIRTETRYSSFHIEPCPSCRDHEHTQYPDGYMD